MLTFNFSVDEINLILTGLGDQPYKNVAQLISKIHSQANPQIQSGSIPQLAAEQNPQGGVVAGGFSHGAGREPLTPPRFAS